MQFGKDRYRAQRPTQTRVAEDLQGEERLTCLAAITAGSTKVTAPYSQLVELKAPSTAW